MSERPIMNGSNGEPVAPILQAGSPDQLPVRPIDADAALLAGWLRGAVSDAEGFWITR